MGSGGKSILQTAVFVGASFLLPGSAAFAPSLFVKRFVVSYGLSLVTKALAPKFKTPNELFAEQEQQDTTSTSTVSSWKIPYGKTISGGQLVYSTVSKKDNNYAHLIVVFSPVEIESYEALFLNSDKVADVEGDPNKTLKTDGYIQSEKWYATSPVNLASSAAQISVADGGSAMFYGWVSTGTITASASGFSSSVSGANNTQSSVHYRGNGTRKIYNNSTGSAKNISHTVTRIQDANHHAGLGWSFITIRNNFQLTSDYKDLAFFALYDGSSDKGSTAYNTAISGHTAAMKNGNEENAYHFMFSDPVIARELLGRDTAENKNGQNTWWIYSSSHLSDPQFVNSATYGQTPITSEFTKGSTLGSTDFQHQRAIFKPLAFAHLTVKKDDIFQGALPNVSAIIKGVKVYDPRDTNHSQTDSSTWEWSDNPALCLLDYLTNSEYGCGVSYDRIDIDSFKDLANTCDEVITYSHNSTAQTNTDTVGFSEGKLAYIGSGVYEWQKRDIDEIYFPFSVGDRIYFEHSDGSNKGDLLSEFTYSQPIYITELLEDGSGFRTINTGITQDPISHQVSIRYTRKKYTCNGMVDADSAMKQNIDNILACMAAKLIYVGGKYILIGGEYSAQEGRIDEDSIVGDVSVTKITPRRDRFNTVKTTFTSHSEDYKPREAVISQDQDRVDDDEEETIVEVQLPLVTSPNQAKYLADITRKRSEYSTVVTMTCNMKVLQYQVGDVIQFSYSKWGYTDELFEISEMKINFGNPQTVDVTLLETGSNIYTIGSGA